MNNCPNCQNKEYSIKIKEGNFLVVQCTNCGLIYLLNPPELGDIYEDYYEIDFKASDYSENSKLKFLREIFEINSQRLSLITSTVRDIKDKLVLDIGSGSGLFLQSCKRIGITAEGIDISEKAKKFASENFGLTVYNKTTEELISENKKYDVITLWHVLEHFENPAEELKKISLLLNDNGYIFIEVPNFNSIKFHLSGKKWVGGNHPKYHRVFFTSKTLTKTLDLCGFKNITKINFTYRLKDKSHFYYLTKKIFNTFSADAFLNFIVQK